VMPPALLFNPPEIEAVLLAVKAWVAVNEPLTVVRTPVRLILTALALVVPILMVPLVPEPVLTPVSKIRLPLLVLVPLPSPVKMLTVPVVKPEPPVVVPERTTTAVEAAALSAVWSNGACKLVAK